MGRDRNAFIILTQNLRRVNQTDCILIRSSWKQGRSEKREQRAGPRLDADVWAAYASVAAAGC